MAAAMAAALEETPITYQDLADIEKDFDDVEREIIRKQVSLTAPIYHRRQRLVSQIPNFWPLVIEHAPPDVDQFIQPSDSTVLLSSLTSLSVRHFQLEAPDPKDHGDPRSVIISWEFAENSYFEDTVLEKTFWYRQALDGWQGLVSEPVRIRWKTGRDLTGGLLDLVCDAWDVEQAQTQKGKGQKDRDGDVELTPEQMALKDKISATVMGAVSFFAWFGFIGRRVTAEESAEAFKKEAEEREMRRQGMKVHNDLESSNGSDAGGFEELEIFPEGGDLAVSIVEGLWPGAIRYFIQAQEQDALSDTDFESVPDEDDDANEEGGPSQEAEDDTDESEASQEAEGRPAKKRRS